MKKLIKKYKTGYTIKRNGNKAYLEPGDNVYNRQYISNWNMSLLGTDIKAGDFFKVVKDKTGKQSVIITRKINPRKDVVETNSDFQNAYKYAYDYLNSHGFRLRFLNFKLPDNINEIIKINPKKPKLKINHYYNMPVGGANINYKNAAAHYNLYNNSITTKAFINPNIMIHELGHWLDHLFIPDRKWKLDIGFDKDRMPGSVTYSSLWPQLRDNVYNTVYNYKDTGPMSLNTQMQFEHDARPSELYANLLMFRKFLNDNGIYNSNVANNPFTKEHLKKVKLILNIPDRILNFINLYDDDKLVNVMNTVAYNEPIEDSKTNLNTIYYA